jgi:predicted nucleic acid-binding protein
MSAPIFVDTNVFIYALDARDRQKQAAARAWRDELWKSRRGRTSFQVLQECYAQLIRLWPNKRDEARAEARDLLAWRPVAVDTEILERSWKIQDRYHLSFWDALIVSAAKSAECRHLLTEDLQAGQELDGVMIVNPFETTPSFLSSR